MADAAERLPPLRVLLFGPPGSGKGTQAAMLAERFSIPAISTGEMLRQAVAGGTELGRRVESIMVTGELVDDATMADVVRERLARPDAARGFVLDGYPRTLAQAETLEGILGRRGEALDAAIFLEVPEEELVRRMTGRQRADDREDVVRERLRVYREKTAPLVDHYREQGLLRQVDGARSVAVVGESILSALRAETGNPARRAG